MLTVLQLAAATTYCSMFLHIQHATASSRHQARAAHAAKQHSQQLNHATTPATLASTASSHTSSISRKEGARGETLAVGICMHVDDDCCSASAAAPPPPPLLYTL